MLSALLLSLTFFSYTNVIAQAPQQAAADNEYQEGAVLWAQASGEMRALSYQAFNLARMVLDRDLRMRHRSRLRPAIIVDVDETILDNSRYQATLLKNHQNHSGQRFTEWVNRAEATALPGAVEFLRYATSRGVRVFYITNRKEVEKEGTAVNLKKLGFPEVNDQTLLVRTDPKTSSKELRRDSVEKKHRIVLLMGDNLNDFAEVFDNSKTVADRLAAADLNKDKFGVRFIVLPNAMYGDWENAIYDYNFQLDDKQKAAKRRGYLKSY
ncbi:MAG TPA: 5'-nucleotidase, lipoprotein e(P4) family [Pyrinomonadaceae bacterium]|nr:5'-nucleotidase, lipoprotein e(P4) family [Pyrinomonadaceae bacterium]